MTSAAHRGRRQTDTCGAARDSERETVSGNTKTLLAAKRGRISHLCGRNGAVDTLRGDIEQDIEECTGVWLHVSGINEKDCPQVARKRE